MKTSIHTFSIIIAGIVLSLVLAGFGTFVALHVTAWGRTITGQQQSSAILWSAVVSGAQELFLFVLLPTVVTVGFVVGFFATRVPPVAAIFAALPISIASGFDWQAAMLLLASGIAGSLAYWWRSPRPAPPIQRRA